MLGSLPACLAGQCSSMPSCIHCDTENMVHLTYRPYGLRTEGQLTPNSLLVFAFSSPANCSRVQHCLSGDAASRRESALHSMTRAHSQPMPSTLQRLPQDPVAVIQMMGETQGWPATLTLKNTTVTTVLVCTVQVELSPLLATRCKVFACSVGSRGLQKRMGRVLDVRESASHADPSCQMFAGGGCR